jgi:regulator of protease activity HflC (stomatin/prohibitin superfamily)|nr:MAG TPA: High frequency of lysogenization C protein [Caudoviricetes sp.]
MFLIILSIILVVVTAGLLGINTEAEKWEFKPRMIISLLWLIIILFGCFSTIKTGEIGIKTRFGKIVGSTTNEGIIFKSPIEKIEKINIKVQKYENKDALSTSTKDMQIVNNIKVSINYQIDGTNVVELYKKVGINYSDTILEPAIQETIKGVISKYTSEELVTKRSEISLDINNTLNERIKNYGINSVSVAINNFDFSEAYNQAIEQKAVAEQNVLKAQQELEQTKVEAEKKIVEAEATNKANELLKQNVTDEVLMKQFIEKWDGKLPTTYAGNDILKMFNLK